MSVCHRGGEAEASRYSRHFANESFPHVNQDTRFVAKVKVAERQNENLTPAFLNATGNHRCHHLLLFALPGLYPPRGYASIAAFLVAYNSGVIFIVREFFCHLYRLFAPVQSARSAGKCNGLLCVQ